jgi:hypothetical protein
MNVPGFDECARLPAARGSWDQLAAPFRIAAGRALRCRSSRSGGKKALAFRNFLESSGAADQGMPGVLVTGEAEEGLLSPASWKKGFHGWIWLKAGLSVMGLLAKASFYVGNDSASLTCGGLRHKVLAFSARTWRRPAAVRFGSRPLGPRFQNRRRPGLAGAQEEHFEIISIYEIQVLNLISTLYNDIDSL